MKKSVNLLYPGEGTLFVIPIHPTGWAVGLYARVSSKVKRRVPFGYFFYQRYKKIPNPEDINNLSLQDAIYATRFGDLGIADGRWKIIGKIEPWNRSDWPMPDFMIPASDPGCPPWDQLVRYAEDDPNREILRERHPPGSLNLPRAGLPGSGYIEQKLSQLIEARMPS